MTTKNIVQVTDQNFETTVGASTQLVLVDFWATWCAPCKMLKPLVEELAVEYEGRVVIAELDVDANPVTASKFSVLSIPSLILFRAGKPAELESERYLSYSRDVGGLLDRVETGAGQAAFLLRPPAVSDVVEVARAGRVMPQKSTYFFPKPASGIVFNPLQAGIQIGPA